MRGPQEVRGILGRRCLVRSLATVPRSRAGEPAESNVSQGTHRRRTCSRRANTGLLGRARATLGQHEVQKSSVAANDSQPSIVPLACSFIGCQRRPAAPRSPSQGGSAGSNPVGGTSRKSGPDQRKAGRGRFFVSRRSACRESATRTPGCTRLPRQWAAPGWTTASVHSSAPTALTDFR